MGEWDAQLLPSDGGVRVLGTYGDHTGLDNRTIGLPEPDEHGCDFAQEDVICDLRLGGVLKSYRWKTAA